MKKQLLSLFPLLAVCDLLFRRVVHTQNNYYTAAKFRKFIICASELSVFIIAAISALHFFAGGEINRISQPPTRTKAG